MKLTFTTYVSLFGVYLTFLHGCGKAVMEDNYKYASSDASAKIAGEENYSFEKGVLDEHGKKQLDTEALPPKLENPQTPVEEEIDEEIIAVPPTVISGAYLTCTSDSTIQNKQEA